jgi:hypothetical protein
MTATRNGGNAGLGRRAGKDEAPPSTPAPRPAPSTSARHCGGRARAPVRRLGCSAQQRHTRSWSTGRSAATGGGPVLVQQKHQLLDQLALPPPALVLLCPAALRTRLAPGPAPARMPALRLAAPRRRRAMLRLAALARRAVARPAPVTLLRSERQRRQIGSGACSVAPALRLAAPASLGVRRILPVPTAREPSRRAPCALQRPARLRGARAVRRAAGGGRGASGARGGCWGGGAGRARCGRRARSRAVTPRRAARRTNQTLSSSIGTSAVMPDVKPEAESAPPDSLELVVVRDSGGAERSSATSVATADLPRGGAARVMRAGRRWRPPPLSVCVCVCERERERQRERESERECV